MVFSCLWKIMSKDKILQVSERLFFAKTYSDVKLDVIANELNIQKPSLYHYFKDKKDLFSQTINFSMANYLWDLKKIVAKKNVKDFLTWYITYPSKEKNLFAISFQKAIFGDNATKTLVLTWKQKVYEHIKEFLKDMEFDGIQIYLMLNLLDKLAMENCIDWYCLKYDIKQIVDKVYKMFCVCGK